jgi:hypothetical protein
MLDYFQAPARQAATVHETRHRPYPLPAGSWVMGQTWQQLVRADIHHPPWPLQLAHAELDRNTMAPPGLALLGVPALLHFAERQDVLIWPPQRL